MKRIILVFVVLFLILGVVGCDTNKNEDVGVKSYRYYVNTTEHWDVSTYNGYKCTSLNKIKNDDGTYTVTFDFEVIGELEESE